ncbi:MAG TPA: prephenate dehydrogenase [Planctomycetaceae bacterium]|nr:prephenate dehydrogenase [Planctomycetaceae bacterium]
MPATAPEPLEDTLAIVGVGLIGGSIAAAARRRGLARRILGVGRNRQRLEQARTAGVIDAVASDPAGVGSTALVIFCTPVDQIARGAGDWLPRLPPGCLVTDAGSTKHRLCDALAPWAGRQPAFIGSHPIAGGEKQGFEHADPDLFVGRTCVITPQAQHREQDIVRVTRFWEALGMMVVSLSPAEHDLALAATSHVPHVVAAALAASLTDADRGFTGTGFATTTRIAAGDPELWTAILRENAAEVAGGLSRIQQRLAAFEQALRSDDASALKIMLQAAKTQRDALDG